MKAACDLLYDSEASLRLVDRAIGDLSSARAQRLESYADTAATVVRFCHDAGLLDAGRLEALQDMTWRLGAPSSTSELTTVEVLDGLNRAVALVDALELTEGVTDDMRQLVAASLEQQLGMVAEHLRGHEISARQMADMSAVFGELRGRIGQLAVTERRAPFAREPIAL